MADAYINILLNDEKTKQLQEAGLAEQVKTIDGKPVFVLFLMLSPNTKVHLQLLARLGFCLRDHEFIDFLQKQSDSDAFCRRVEQMEKRMEKARGA